MVQVKLDCFERAARAMATSKWCGVARDCTDIRPRTPYTVAMDMAAHLVHCVYGAQFG
jgi:hypothetical protein